MEELIRRGYKLVEWVGDLETQPYDWRDPWSRRAALGSLIAGGHRANPRPPRPILAGGARAFL